MKSSKILSCVLACAMVASMSVSGFAEKFDANDSVIIGNSNSYTQNEWIGISTQEPIFAARDIDIPTGSPHNIDDDGTYYFSAVSESQTIYTNYLLVGKDDYTVSITNNGKANLTVKCKTRFSTFSTNTVAPGTTSKFSLAGIGKDKEFYLRFSGSLMDFSGSVS